MDVRLDPEQEKALRAAAQAAGVDADELARRYLGDALARRRHLLEHIDEGTRQLAGGACREFDDAGLEEYFSSVQRRGRERYSVNKNGG